jgi:hypothetical protein
MEANVVLSDQSKIGKVVDVVLDDGGCVDYLVVSYEDRYVMVPWGVATVNFEERAVYIDVTRDKWRGIPTFTRDRWPSFSDASFTDKMRGVYGERWRREHRGEGVRERPEERRERPAVKDKTTDKPPETNKPGDRPFKDKEKPPQS